MIGCILDYASCLLLMYPHSNEIRSVFIYNIFAINNLNKYSRKLAPAANPKPVQHNIKLAPEIQTVYFMSKFITDWVMFYYDLESELVHIQKLSS